MYKVRWIIPATLLIASTLQAETTSFSINKVMDTKGTGNLAITYLIPKGWTSSDQVFWNFQNPLVPMFYVLMAKNADRSREVVFLSASGSKYGKGFDGSVFGVLPPKNPSDLLVDQFRRTHLNQEFEIVSAEDTPVPSMFSKFQGSGASSSGFNSSVTLRFTKDGIPCLYKAQIHFDGSQNAPMNFSGHSSYNGLWFVQDGMGVTGPEASFATSMRIAGVILSSRKMDPRFFQAYADVADDLIKQGAKQTADYVNMIQQKMQASYQSGLSEDRSRAFKEQMAAKDKHTREFCDYLLDRERYTDGKAEFILPSGYNRAIANGSGTYVLTNDAAYKPTGEWHELGKAN